MMNIEGVHELESWFDQDCAINFKFTHAKYFNEFELITAYLRLYKDEDFKGVISQCKILFPQFKHNINVQIFLLEFGLSATETIYDLQQRKQLMKFWNAIEGWPQSAWAKYVKAYSEALTPLFAGHLREADAQMNTAYVLAKEMGYLRGEMRSLFHLALISEERGLQFKTLEILKECEAMAQANGNTRFLNRVRDAQKRVTDDTNESFSAQASAFLRQKDLPRFRAHLLKEGQMRRAKGWQRGSTDFELWMALYCALTGKLAFEKIVYSSFDDQVQLEQYFTTKERWLTLTSSEHEELKCLRKTLGINFVQVTRLGDVEISGVKSCNQRSTDVDRFVNLVFRSHGEVQKEDITREVWGLDYDPVIHDPKIYKLIHLSRKVVGQKDWVLNTYGKYRLNPKLRGEAG